MRITMLTKNILIVVFSMLIFACAGTVSSIDEGDEKIYIMSEHVASRIMLSAMNTEIDKDNIRPLTAPQVGYSGKVQWGVDKDTITLIAKNAVGKNQSGEEVRGYVFEARHSGTAPAAGAPTVKRLLANVVKDARQLGEEASFVRFNK